MTKAITLYQPFATLIMVGAKHYETRSWSTTHRGALYIHASKSTKWLNLLYEEPFFTHLYHAGITEINQLPLGVILGYVDLRNCVRTETLTNLSDDELEFGDFSDLRFAWELQHVVPLGMPIAVNGRQRLWNFDVSLIEQRRF